MNSELWELDLLEVLKILANSQDSAYQSMGEGVGRGGSTIPAPQSHWLGLERVWSLCSSRKALPHQGNRYAFKLGQVETPSYEHLGVDPGTSKSVFQFRSEADVCISVDLVTNDNNSLTYEVKGCQGLSTLAPLQLGHFCLSCLTLRRLNEKSRVSGLSHTRLKFW